MRGFVKLATAPGRPFAAKHPFLSSYSYPLSTFSGDGGGSSGRGRGRGGAPPPHPPRVPGAPAAADDEPSAPAPALGRGIGQPPPILPSSPVLPSFASWLSSPSPKPSAAGRGRGRPPVEDPNPQPKKPIFIRNDDPVPDPDPSRPLPSRFVTALPGAGRGMPAKPPAGPESRPAHENRHIRPRPAGGSTSTEPRPSPTQSKINREEAVRKAMEVLNRGGGRGGGRGRGGRGMGRGGRGGRGGRFDPRRPDANSEEIEIFLGDNADGDRLLKVIGEEGKAKLKEEFDEMMYRVLPSPTEEAYLEALHTNNMIEYEPEYLVNFDNPDIDEKPPMPLLEVLEKVKPFIMAYDGIQSQEEWEEAIKEILEKLPHLEELMEMYAGPTIVTAKQQQLELERVANTLPENIPSSVKRFTDRAVLSLQSNPGWGWDKKCQFMDKLTWEVTQHYK